MTARICRGQEHVHSVSSLFAIPFSFLTLFCVCLLLSQPSAYRTLLAAFSCCFSNPKISFTESHWLSRHAFISLDMQQQEQIRVRFCALTTMTDWVLDRYIATTELYPRSVAICICCFFTMASQQGAAVCEASRAVGQELLWQSS